MGKILIIKGADFSVNAVDSYPVYTEVCLYDDEATITENRYDSTSISGSTDFYDISINEAQRPTGIYYLTKIKAKLAATGTFSLLSWLNKPTATGQGTVVQTWTITQTGIQELELNTPLEVTPGMYIGVGNVGDCRFKYNNNNTHTEGYGLVYGATNKRTTGSLGISYYGYTITE